MGTVYHFEHKEDGDFIIKTHRDSGQEAVYNTLTGEISIGNSTFNYAPQSSAEGVVPFDAHHRYDMEPYYEFGGDPNAPASAEATKNQEKFDNNPDAQKYWDEQKELFLNPPIQDEYEKRYEG